MSPNGKVRVVVKTRRVVVGIAMVTNPMYAPSGVLLGYSTNRVALFGSRLDEAHAKAIKEGRTVSSRLGLDLEVVDTSNYGPFRRLFSLVRRGALPEPALLVAP
ncbi:MAG: hypothetical protein JRN06_09480 [Nitrososphaerota archaeon]|nr:hypothetical protein [Nitrososphaerota archaeon]MDG7024816.1 hypothetical protein [Nitrososphaerota archaeon]